MQGFPASYEGCSSLLKHALSLNEAGMESRIHSGLVCTGDRFITNRMELDTIKQRFPGGLAVDMESAAIAQTCHLYNVPFLSFRIISDTPGVEDHASQYADSGEPWQSAHSSRYGPSSPPFPAIYNS